MKLLTRSTPTCRQSVAICGILLLLGVSPSLSLGQLPQTRLNAIFPPGAKAGSTVELKLTSGVDLEDINRLLFNHAGITAVQKTTESNGKKTPVANTFVVTVAGNVPPGNYEVSAVGLFGLSNPRTFVVGSREEIQETEPNNASEKATEIKLDTVVNSRIQAATDVDFFKFQGKKGQRVIATCHAARIDSRLSATLEIYNSGGLRIAYGRNQIRRDPLVDVTLAADGEYYIKVYDFVYGGSQEYVYRLCAHTGPHIDFVLPPAGVAGTTGQFTLYGRNLYGGQPAGVSLDGNPLQKLTVSIPVPKDATTLKAADNMRAVEAGIDGFTYVLNSPNGRSNPVTIQYAASVVAIEQEPNDTPEKAQKISIPSEFSGQFQSKGDIDYVAFDAKAKDVYYVEVFGQRNGSTTDPYLILEQVTVAADGKETVKRITVQDDNATNLAPNIFDTVSDDPVYRFQVPADSLYRISVRDRYFEARGDPRLVYRLSIRKEQPDYRLVALPYLMVAANTTLSASVGLRRGDSYGMQIMAYRRDGFDGVINVTAEGLPNGVTCKGASIGPKQPSALLVFTASESAPEWVGEIRVVGKARVDDPVKVRAVTAAKAAVKPATDALPKLVQAAQKADTALKTATAQLAQAKAAAGKNPKDKNLVAKVTATQKAFDTATQTAKTANAAKTAGEKRIADANAAVKKTEAEKKAAAKEVSRAARSATIAYGGSTVVPSIARLAGTLGLSVIKEPAPFQVTTSVFRVEANQSRQILIPVKLLKRAGFDNNVTLTFTGLPRTANLRVTNKPINKGKTDELLQIFVNTNSPEGTYTLFLKAQGTVSYKKNPARETRAKAAQTVATKAAAAAAAVAKTTTQTRVAAVKKAAADAAKLKTTTTAKTTAEKTNATAQAALKLATASKAAADKAAATATAAAKVATDKAAAAKKAAAADATNKGLAAARAAADKAVVVATNTLKKAQAAKAVADRKLVAAQAAVNKATAVLTAAQKAFAAAGNVAKVSQDAKTKAEATAKAADVKSKAAAAAKAVADREAKAAIAAARPLNKIFYPPSTPIIIQVKKGPATLSAAVPGGGVIKKGAKIDVKVTVRRINGFKGPVTLSLPLPPGVVGLSAPAVTIPADKNDGILSIQAAGNATDGQLANMVIRGTMNFEGKAAVDAVVKLNVTK